MFRTDALPELEAELRGAGIEARGRTSWWCARSVARERAQPRAASPASSSRWRRSAELLRRAPRDLEPARVAGAAARPRVHGRLLDALRRLLEPRATRVAAGYAALRALRRASSRALARRRPSARAQRQDFLAFQLARDRRGASSQPGELEALGARALAPRARERAARARRGAARRVLTGDGGERRRGARRGPASRRGRARLDAARALDAALAPLAERLRARARRARDAARELERYADGVDVGSRAARRGRGAARAARAAAPQVRPQRGRDPRASASASAASSRRSRAATSALGALARRARSSHARRSPPTRRRSSAGAREAAARRSRATRRGVARASSRCPARAFEVALERVARRRRRSRAARAAPRQAELRFSANPGEAPRAAAAGRVGRRAVARLPRAEERAAPRGARHGARLRRGRRRDRRPRGGSRRARCSPSSRATHQVLCITHLPQIAARGDDALPRRRSATPGRAHGRPPSWRSTREERVEEIARMAGGERVTARPPAATPASCSRGRRRPAPPGARAGRPRRRPRDKAPRARRPIEHAPAMEIGAIPASRAAPRGPRRCRPARRVRVSAGFYEGLELPIDREWLVIGRGRSAEMTLAEPTLSRAHAAFGFDGERLLRPGSRQHERHARERRAPRARVALDGDEVQIGRLRLRVRLPARARPPRAATPESRERVDFAPERSEICAPRGLLYIQPSASREQSSSA